MDFTLAIRIDAPLEPMSYGEPSAFVQHVEALIVEETPARRKTIGAIQSMVVRASDATESLFDVCDSESEELSHFYEAFHTKSGALKKSVKVGSEGCGSILYLKSLTLDDAHRGKGLGLKALWVFLEQLGFQFYLVALEPHPMMTPEQKQKDPAAVAAGIAKLATHWARLGFEWLPKTKYMYLDPMTVQPSPFDATDGEDESNGEGEGV